MKSLLLMLLLSGCTVTAFGQACPDYYYTMTFIDTLPPYCLHIDTLSNPNNIWKIGPPQKTIFTSAFSPPNAIVTGVTNPYPPNDTSVFTIENIALGSGFVWPHTVIFAGRYNVNSDTLTDYGTLTFSPDNGTTWIDLINDPAYAPFIGWSSTPVLTGNSNGWQYFGSHLANLGPLFNIQDGDTVLYRFTFISDSIHTGKDGLMFDDLHFEDWIEGVQELNDNGQISITPNPASDWLYIHGITAGDKAGICIMNTIGQVLYYDRNLTGSPIDIRQLPDGMYVIRYSDSIKVFQTKCIVSH